ncbi:hypothetical protein CPB84DRAFT_1748136 [Gymnopilus junonius]|uniref:Uncharacterized protein n=1 Tax=Gymnopilus junonius TaxID=109634 RepID=A0A9P5NMT7_GYMJU|nr:hypothetical protein CPB84DRAFT_1748136 [Gymnopilus junonius]
MSSLASNTNTSTHEPATKKRGHPACASTSSVEVVEVTKVVPKAQESPKKCARSLMILLIFVKSANASKPCPGSPAYALQGPITVITKTAAVKSVACKLSFGDILFVFLPLFLAFDFSLIVGSVCLIPRPSKDELNMTEMSAVAEKRIQKPSQKAKDAAETENALVENSDVAPRPCLCRKTKDQGPSKDVAIKESVQSSSAAPLYVVSSDKDLLLGILTKAVTAGLARVEDAAETKNALFEISDVAPRPCLCRKTKDQGPSKDVAIKESVQSSSTAPLYVVSSDEDLLLGILTKAVTAGLARVEDAAETKNALFEISDVAPRPRPRPKTKDQGPSKDVAIKESVQSSSAAPLYVVSSDEDLPLGILTKAVTAGLAHVEDAAETKNALFEISDVTPRPRPRPKTKDQGPSNLPLAGVEDSRAPVSDSASNQSELHSDSELSDTPPSGKLMSDANKASKEWSPDAAKKPQDVEYHSEDSALYEPQSVKVKTEPGTAPEEGLCFSCIFKHGSDTPPVSDTILRSPKVDTPATAAGTHSRNKEDSSSDGSETDESESASDSSEVEASSVELAALHELYPDLPKLKTFAILKPYHRLQQAMGDESDGWLLSYDAILASVDKDAHARFYANLVHADMNFFRIDKSRIVHRQSGANAVFVIPGAVAECHLQSGAKHGFGDGYQLKKLLLYPFDKNHDRTISFLGSIANFDEVSTQWVDSSLMFSMRKDGSNTTGSSPVKKSSFFVSLAATTTSAVCYPGSLAFSDNVPIYDGRKGPFKFRADDFNNIKKLPLWCNGKQDLPPFVIVAVGFTFNTYNILVNDTSGSFNIMFAIYLGFAKEKTFVG